MILQMSLGHRYKIKTKFEFRFVLKNRNQLKGVHHIHALLVGTESDTRTHPEKRATKAMSTKTSCGLGRKAADQIFLPSCSFVQMLGNLESRILASAVCFRSWSFASAHPVDHEMQTNADVGGAGKVRAIN